MASTARAKNGPLDRWTRFLNEEPAAPPAKTVADDDEGIAAVIALAKKHDTRVHSFIETLVGENTSFSVYDIEAYPELLLRGRSNEPWNEGGKVMSSDDVCLARNGGGDLYVWNAKNGEVRFLVHDEGWRTKRTHDDVDDFVEDAMSAIVENAGMEQVEDADELYVARLRFAISIAGDDSLDDDVKEHLEELDAD